MDDEAYKAFMDVTTVQWSEGPSGGSGTFDFRWMMDYAPKIGIVSLRRIGNKTVAVRLGQPMPAWDRDFR